MHTYNCKGTYYIHRRLAEKAHISTVEETHAFRGFRVAERLAYKQAVSEWCLRNAERCLERDSLEEGLKWAQLSGQVIGVDYAPLTFLQLERQLLIAASRLPGSILRWQPRRDTGKRWLHVLDEALPYGGHTAMVVRWMQLDPHDDQHNVILLNQRGSVPDSMLRTIQNKEGKLKILDSGTSIVARASKLRQYAWENSDVVVLYTYTHTVVAPVAFGIPGGPPVLYMNHAAHLFWTGCAVADIVLNCRGSEYEREWNIKFRGIDVGRNATLPIPLPYTLRGCCSVSKSRDVQVAARAALSLSQEAKVILTVGSGYKYVPLPGLNFFGAAELILQACPNAVLVAVGPTEDKYWQRLRKSTNGRVLALGLQTDLKKFHDAADLYIEGFPFGSTTALLEAALQGLPCILAPATAPPPFGTDGIAVDQLSRPTCVAEYASRVIDLVQNLEEGAALGKALAVSVARHHTGSGWRDYLYEVRARIPDEHRIYPLRNPVAPPEYCKNFWTAYLSRFRPSDALTIAFGEAVLLGLNPRPDEILKRAVIRAQRIRRPRSSQSLIILSLVSRVTSWLSPRCRIRVYEFFIYYLRPSGRIMRMAWQLRSHFKTLGKVRRAHAR